MEQMHSHSDGIEKSLTDTKSLLSRLHEEITKTLDKIATREKYLNSQLEHHLNEFRSMQVSVCFYVSFCLRDQSNDGMLIMPLG